MLYEHTHKDRSSIDRLKKIEKLFLKYDIKTFKCHAYDFIIRFKSIFKKRKIITES